MTSSSPRMTPPPARAASSIPDAQVVQRYADLAPVYDQRWGAYNRRTLSEVLHTLALHGSERILDIGCGTGVFETLAVARHPGLSLVGVDVTPAMLDVARQKLRDRPGISWCIAHAEALPFPSRQFDAVVSANMFHYARDPQRMVVECARVLRPGGWLVLLDWCGDFWHCRLLHVWLRWTNPAYMKMYRLQDVCALMEAAGLTVEQERRFLAPPCYGVLLVAASRAD